MAEGESGLNVYLFTGPTLSPSEARKELDATCLPPVSQGDVYRAALKYPLAIGIIDGYFDRVPAVWHKEILWAMAQGIHVYGAASMGALRAAEVAPFGMVGVGRIFSDYRNGTLEDDDEVAVAHASAADGYRPLSEAMVNIRYTLAKAESAGVISAGTRSTLESLCKGLYYPERSYPALLERAAGRAPAAELDAFRAWLPEGRVDQKRADALAMLTVIRDRLAADPRPQTVSFVFEHTVFWDHALHSAGWLGLLSDGSPETLLASALLEELQLDGAAYARAMQGAAMRHLVMEEAQRLGFAASPESVSERADNFRRAHDLVEPARFGRWLSENHLTPERFDALMGENAVLSWARPRLRGYARRRLVDHMRFTGDYQRLLSRATNKQRTLEAHGLSNPGVDDTGLSAEALLDWYLSRLPRPEADIEGHATLLELAHQETDGFLRALAREYCYCRLQGKNSESR